MSRYTDGHLHWQLSNFISFDGPRLAALVHAKKVNRDTVSVRNTCHR